MLKRTRFLVLFFLISKFFSVNAAFRTTLQKNDPNPLYTSNFPFTPLYQPNKDFLTGRSCFLDRKNMAISITPFYQKASSGTNIYKNESEIGDLTGRWNMLALLPFNTPTSSPTEFDETNLGVDIPTVTCQSVNINRLVEIRDNLLNCIRDVFYDSTNMNYNPYPSQLKTVQGLLSLQSPRELFGFFSVPIKYRKHGVRFEFSGVLYKGLGFTVDIGISNITQNAKFIDMTGSTTCGQPELCLSSCPTNVTPLVSCESFDPFPTATVSQPQWANVVKCVHNQVMNNLKDIAKAVNLDLCHYDKTSIEDFHAELFWRDAFCVNNNRSKEWPRFLFIPFFQLGFTYAIAKEQDYNQAFSISSGNNGFNCSTFLAGFSLDFANTIEIGGEAGFNHYFKRNIDCFRIPTNEWQNGIIPYSTKACVEPGDTWHTSVYMHSRYFIDHVSFWGQYVYITHNKDCISVIGPNVSVSSAENGLSDQDPVYLPGELRCKSDWNAQLLNLALNYDVSPNCSLGVLAQLPLTRTNAYKSSMVLASLNLFF